MDCGHVFQHPLKLAMCRTMKRVGCVIVIHRMSNFVDFTPFSQKGLNCNSIFTSSMRNICVSIVPVQINPARFPDVLIEDFTKRVKRMQEPKGLGCIGFFVFGDRNATTDVPDKWWGRAFDNRGQ